MTLLCVGAAGLATPAVLAAGDASFSLSPSSSQLTVGQTFTVTVSETSSAGDQTNAVQANLTYPASLLTYQSMSLAGPFTLCAQQSQTTGSIKVGCASPSAQSGTQTVVRITFTAVTAGTAQVAMTSGSDIDNTSGSSVWNGTLPSAQYTITTPQAPVSSPTPTPPSTTTSTSTKTTTPKTTTAPTAPAGPTQASSSAPVIVPTAPKAPTSSSSASLTLTALDASKHPVKGATVTIGSSEQTTNAQGVAYFAGIKSGTYPLVVKYHDKTVSKQSVALASGENKLVSVTVAQKQPLLLTLVLWLLAIVVLAGLAGGAWWFIQRRHGVINQSVTYDPTVVTGGEAFTQQPAVNSPNVNALGQNVDQTRHF